MEYLRILRHDKLLKSRFEHVSPLATVCTLS